MVGSEASGNYPKLEVKHIHNPNRFYAVPVLGIFVKMVMLIPVWFWVLVLMLTVFVLNLINSFVVLFTGKYWQPSYKYSLGVMRYTTKVTLFFQGLTNRYPGFSLANDDDLISIDMPMPESPSRAWAIPVLSGIAKAIILTPYAIYSSVISNAAGLGVFGSFVPVLFKGRYPESTYELARDSMRLSLSSSAYWFGLSDSYPSFRISMNHKTIKIVLIVLGVIAMLWNFSSNMNKAKNSTQNQGRNYYNQQNIVPQDLYNQNIDNNPQSY